MNKSMTLAVVWLSASACGSDGMESDHSNTVRHPLPNIMREEVTLLEVEGEAETALSHISVAANAPTEVNVTGVTSAVLQGDDVVRPCRSAAMSNEKGMPQVAGRIVLLKGDRMVVSWMPEHLAKLPDGAYSQQVAIQGMIAPYIVDGYSYSGRPEGVLAIGYRPFEVTAGSVRLLSFDEYREVVDAAQADGVGLGEITAVDRTPKNCVLSDVAAIVTVTHGAESP